MEKREQLMLQLSLIQEQNQRRPNPEDNDPFRRLNSVPALCRRLSEWHSYHVLQLTNPVNQKSCLALVAPIWLCLLRLAVETPISRSVKDAVVLLSDWQSVIEREQDSNLESGQLIQQLLSDAQQQPCDIRAVFVSFFRIQRSLHIGNDQLFRQTIQLLELGASFRIDTVGSVYA